MLRVSLTSTVCKRTGTGQFARAVYPLRRGNGERGGGGGMNIDRHLDGSDGRVDDHRFGSEERRTSRSVEAPAHTYLAVVSTIESQRLKRSVRAWPGSAQTVSASVLTSPMHTDRICDSLLANLIHGEPVQRAEKMSTNTSTIVATVTVHCHSLRPPHRGVAPVCRPTAQLAATGISW